MNPSNPEAWIEWDREHAWHPYTQMRTAPPPIPIARAEGVWLHTADGRKVLDGISSWWVNLHGHAHPRLNRALAAQAEKMAQVIFAGATHEPAATLAARLVERAPGRLPRVFYSDDGSTAVEVALKMAYQYWRNRGEPRRTLFVALERAYHGDTFGAMAAGEVSTFHEAFRDLLFEVRRVPAPSCDRGATDCADALARLLDREGDRIAAIIAEPMLQGAGGMIVWPADYLRRLGQLARSHGVLFIADEVLTGFGRTGRLFACEHGPVAPDILCLSKGLTGGYLPLAATLATEQVYEGFLSEDRTRALLHGHSYTANALACAVALESLKLLDEERSLERVARLERLFRERLEGLGRNPAVLRTRGIGGMAAMDLRPSGSGGYMDALGPRLAADFLERGVFLRPLGDVLYFLPPYAITDEEAHWVFDVIEDVLAGLGG